MTCPQCDREETIVSDSRPFGKWSRRRRKCNNCGFKFNTIEITEETAKDCFRKLKLLQQLAKITAEVTNGQT